MKVRTRGRSRVSSPGGWKVGTILSTVPKALAQRLRLLATYLGIAVSSLIQEMVEEQLPSKEFEVGRAR